MNSRRSRRVEHPRYWSLPRHGNPAAVAVLKTRTVSAAQRPALSSLGAVALTPGFPRALHKTAIQRWRGRLQWRQRLRSPTTPSTAYGLFQMATAKKRPPPGAGSKNQRAAFAARVPKPVKRQAGRATAPNVPANIRVFGIDLSDDERSRIRQRLGAKLGKFANSIERVSVRVKDVNGPRGGVDRACRIKVVLSGLPSVVFENQRASLKASLDGALDGIERAVRRSLQRRRMKPIRVGTR